VSLRARLVLAFALVTLTPLLIIGMGLRRELDRRLVRDFETRADAEIAAVEGELTRASTRVTSQLAALVTALENDNQLRRALTRPDDSDAGYLIEFAARHMALTGLALLRLEDDAGRILSSGHFPGEAGRQTGAVADSLAARTPAITLLATRAAGGDLLVLARIDSIIVAGRKYHVIGGLPADFSALGPLVGNDRLELERPGQLDVGEPGSVLPVHRAGFDVVIVGDAVPAIVEEARVVVSAELKPLQALRGRVDLWLGLGFGVTGLAVLLASWMVANRVSKPLADLAEQTARVDLTNLDVDFSSERTDEVGQLSDLLSDMVRRLKVSRERLTAAERRATIGDVSRQLTHDIKNGLTPIRNVVTHLSEVASEEPAAMAQTFRERQHTLDSSIAYLDALAQNMSGLTPAMNRAPCDLNSALRESAHQGHGEVRLDLDDRDPVVQGDPVALRRVFQNLIGNAVDSVGGSGVVMVTSEVVMDAAGEPAGRATVQDDGPGMTDEELDRAFTEWYTTKQEGTGLGLPIVRRLVLDLGGKLRVETAPGRGTRVIVELPLASENGERSA
jgi:signal transduction histidine kinase